jgi:UDP-glucose 4-epimerase
MSRLVADCKVAIVGGAGFAGSHMVDYLINKRDCDVLVLDNLSAGRREFVHPNAKFVHADITGSERELYQHFKDFKAKFVWNYASIPYIPVSFERPLHVFNVNAMGALKVINAAQEAGAQAIGQISSAEIYGDGPDEENPTGKVSEEEKAVPHSSYGAAKLAIDSLCQVRWKEAKTPVIAVRQHNMLGERETHPYVVTTIISQLYHRGSTIELGNNSVRDFMYAGDQSRMATELLEKGQFGEVYGLGSEHGVKIYDLAQMIGGVMGVGPVNILVDPARLRPWEIWNLTANCAKIYSVISSRPEVTLEEALGRTVRYYLENGCRWCWE